MHYAAKSAITQRGLAESAGVSITTVSRVLSALPDERRRWASAETIEKILYLAEHHGYTRNPHAASLRTSRSNQVGVIIPQLRDLVVATIYEGIEEAGMENGISTYVMNSHDDTVLQRMRTQTMLDRRVDGLIFGDAHLDDNFLDEFKKRDVPYVLTSRKKPGHLSITCDDYQGGRMVAKHLLELGRQNIVIIAGFPFASTSQDRARGVTDGLADAGIHVPHKNRMFVGSDTWAGRSAMTEVLESGVVPDAVFAANDFCAIGALGALREHGLSIPGDVALVGYNDTPLAESVGIPLTSVRSPMVQMGRQSLAALRDLMNGQDVQSQQLKPELVVRASTVG